jgi:hypothetical protein
MNTIDDKAKELVEKYWRLGEENGDTILNWEEAKQCALICVDEIQTAITSYSDNNNLNIKDAQIEFNFWQKVKEKIQSL